MTPTSSSSALSVNSPRPRSGGNGQYRGNWALFKRTAVAAERADLAPSCPTAASLSHSPSWPALLVNCEFHLCAQMNPVLEPNDSHFEFHPDRKSTRLNSSHLGI